MASTFDTLIGRVSDEQLRAELRAAAADLRKITDFGLVFEGHLPETVRLPHHPVRRGIKVTRRDGTDRSMFEVVAVDDATVTVRRIRRADGAALTSVEARELENENAALESLVAVAEFGDPIFPGLRHIGAIDRGGDRPSHVVIKGENHHALETLAFTHAGKVDCIYIDPPYNTGARDWKYNNDYVDPTDVYRHSKWLSFIERRLRLAKRLLKPNAVLVVTIDEHEVNHLGMLLEDIFPEADRQMVSIVINPKGVTRPGSVRFSRVEEYAFFCFLGDSSVSGRGDDLLTTNISDDDPKTAEGRAPRWKGLLRSGTNARREDRENLFFPVLIDPRKGKVVGAGEPLLEGDPDLDEQIHGFSAAWPVRTDLSWGRWGVGHTTLRTLIADGFVKAGAYDKRRKTWALTYLSEDLRAQLAAGVLQVIDRDPETNAVDVRFTEEGSRRLKAVWHRTRHDAGAWGQDLLGKLLGPERLFEFPKSLYSVRDTLAALTRHNPEAVILDFFAGSGTTFHATCLLNAESGGRRSCILVTNNEVSDSDSRRLGGAGLQPGDPAYEARGIFELVAKPRCTATVTGRRWDGQAIEGNYVGGRMMADGFEENVEFFELTYLDDARVEVHRAFAGIAPLLWLRAGAIGPIVEVCVDAAGRSKPYAWTDQYGVLFNTNRWRSFVTKLPDTATTVYIVTDSNTEFSHIAGELPGHLDVVRLYERYLTTFAVNER